MLDLAYRLGGTTLLLHEMGMVVKSVDASDILCPFSFRTSAPACARA